MLLRRAYLPGVIRRAVLCANVAFAACGLSLAGAAQAPVSASASSAAGSLTVAGPEGEPTLLSAADLAALPHTTISVVNGHTKAQESYSGVLLSDLLERVHTPLGDQLHGKALAMYLVAEGADHYKAVYSLAEIDPAFHAGTVIVADHLGSKPLNEKQGPLQLVGTEDKRPARWVRHLVSIRVLSAAQ